MFKSTTKYISNIVVKYPYYSNGCIHRQLFYTSRQFIKNRYFCTEKQTFRKTITKSLFNLIIDPCFLSGCFIGIVGTFVMILNPHKKYKKEL